MDWGHWDPLRGLGWTGGIGMDWGHWDGLGYWAEWRCWDIWGDWERLGILGETGHTGMDREMLGKVDRLGSTGTDWGGLVHASDTGLTRGVGRNWWDWGRLGILDYTGSMRLD